MTIESSGSSERLFRRVGLITLGAVFFLIFVGALVRATGSGMGCPDWPTCFGQWIPPTHESQLPADYHQIYAQRGYLNTDFNVAKTWTEYLNRLTGVIIGLLVLTTMVLTFQYRKQDKTMIVLGILVFVLVGIQGWLGAMVVASNLRPVMISVHMISALIIVGLLIYLLNRAYRRELKSLDWTLLPTSIKPALSLALALVVIQVVMGTQVREAVDTIAQQMGEINREQWRQHFPLIFYVHRSFSALILFSVIWLIWHSKAFVFNYRLSRNIAITLICAILTEIVLGITMDRFSFPAFAQPLHLLCATLIFACLTWSRLAILLGSQQGKQSARTL
ncbi:MAG: COX15/CtaA family protein [Gammaproteobacteria bacterium]|nr:COX15/CtaA family protein [Gammaproteobacteria bacterium]